MSDKPMIKDDHLLLLLAGGVGIYAVYRLRGGEEPAWLPQLGGLGGGGLGLDLSNLLGGISLPQSGLTGLAGLLGGLKLDDATLRDFVSSCLPGGGGDQGGSPTITGTEGAGEAGGRDPTTQAGGWGPGPGWTGDVAEWSPWLQAGVGVLAGGLGVGAAAMLVKTAPVAARGLNALVGGGEAVGRGVGNVIGAAGRRLLQRGVPQRVVVQTSSNTTRTVAATGATKAPGFARAFGGAVAKLFGAVTLGATTYTEVGRAFYGEATERNLPGYQAAGMWSLGELVRELWHGAVGESFLGVPSSQWLKPGYGLNVLSPLGPFVVLHDFLSGGLAGAAEGGSVRSPGAAAFAGAQARAGVGPIITGAAVVADAKATVAAALAGLRGTVAGEPKPRLVEPLSTPASRVGWHIVEPARQTGLEPSFQSPSSMV